MHNFQRYPPLNPSGAADPVQGLTEIVVGTGGEDLFDRNTALRPQPDVFFKTFGYLRLTLGSNGWVAQFVDASGTVLDSSSGTCHA